ncbi:MAG: helix-hairpin-helix domain-containing protein [Lentisphaeria bacterium]|nr:helix-hairpin-helix domain-containing protein [Lentisphaeria bacterium]
MDYINFDLQVMDASAVAELLAYHDRRYWELNAPLISDARYDEITRRLRELAPDHPLLRRLNTPRVAGDGKVRHAEPMLSLDKAYSLEELLEWARKYARSGEEELLVEPKYDGISASFDGRVLATRGDGETGEDISGKLPLIELEAPGYTGPADRPARGEIVIRDDDFRTLYAHIRKKDGGVYKNSRNAVAGIMTLKDISEMIAQKAKLTLVDYNLVSIPVTVDALAGRWEELKTRLAGLPYPMDGIVLKFADTAFRRSLGNTAHHPRGEIAYKFTNRSAATKLLGVEWSFGKNCLTPVALLEPVELSGITIKRASLHNAQNLVDMDLMIGDGVTVERAGDVIPFIASRTPGAERRTPFIADCPACGSSLVRRGPELCCPNSDCPGSGLQLLAAAVRNLGIERLGEPTVAKLMRHCGVRHLRDIFNLTAGELLRLEGFGPKSAANLLAEIRKARTVDDFQLLAALNIPNVGANIAKLLLAAHPFAELRRCDAAQLAEIPGIGPERAAAVAAAMRDRAEELDELLSAVQLRHDGSASDRPTVCFTGKMPEKRSFYEKLASERGYQPVDAVSSSLTLLVAADVAEESSKLRNARKFGVKIVPLAEFLAETETAGASGDASGGAFADLPLFS